MDSRRNELTVDAELGDTVVLRLRPTDQRRLARPLLTLAGTACLVLVVIALLWQGISDTPVSAAIVELNRIIEAARHPVDRTYLITAVDSGDSYQSAPQSFRRGVKPPIDGALLHVRGPNSYVLVRRYADGTEFVTGSDGVQSWAVPPRGDMRVSSDPQRLRGPVPGQQHAIPFINLRDNLERLRNSYNLEVPATDDTANLRGTERLLASRKDTVAGGPKEIVIWYDRESKTIRRMLLERLPQARGGPRSVTLELVEERDLGPQFFHYNAHHAARRQVIQE